MGYNAYDVDLNDFIDADKAVAKYKGAYLCPNEECRQKKVLVHLVEGNHGSYFASYDKNQHCDNCTFSSDKSEGKPYRHKICQEFTMEGLQSQFRKPELAKSTIRNSSLQHLSSKEDNVEKPLYINSIYKLYRLCKYNDINWQITSIYKVSDICIDSRTIPNFKKLLKKTILFIGQTSFCSYDEKKIIVTCRGLNASSHITVSLYLTSNDYWKLYSCKLRNIKKGGVGVNIACVSSFRSRDSFFTPNGAAEQKRYKEYYSYIQIKEIKVLDRVKKV